VWGSELWNICKTVTKNNALFCRVNKGGVQSMRGAHSAPLETLGGAVSYERDTPVSKAGSSCPEAGPPYPSSVE